MYLWQIWSSIFGSEWKVSEFVIKLWSGNGGKPVQSHCQRRDVCRSNCGHWGSRIAPRLWRLSAVQLCTLLGQRPDPRPLSGLHRHRLLFLQMPRWWLEILPSIWMPSGRLCQRFQRFSRLKVGTSVDKRLLEVNVARVFADWSSKGRWNITKLIKTIFCVQSEARER